MCTMSANCLILFAKVFIGRERGIFGIHQIDGSKVIGFIETILSREKIVY